jgi:hypothetical protein
LISIILKNTLAQGAIERIFTPCGSVLDLKLHELPSFRTFGRVKSHFQVNILLKMDENENYELMYRAPGREEHQNVVEILDEIMNRLDSIEKTLSELEKN